MARKFKTYTTSAGFFDLAIAAPSMKAAAEAWGLRSDLFRHGFALQTDDPAIVAATMAQPGIVLRRPVGSTGRFSQHAELPTDLPAGRAKPTLARRASPKPVPPPRPVDEKAARAAAAAFDREEKRRERKRKTQEMARRRERERRERAVAAAEAALEAATRGHQSKVAKIAKERAAVERRAEAEETRWNKERDKLEDALRKARSIGHLRVV